jgi:hypothetical protein
MGYHQDFQRHPRLRAVITATEAALEPLAPPAPTTPR